MDKSIAWGIIIMGNLAWHSMYLFQLKILKIYQKSQVAKRSSPTLIRGQLGNESFTNIECGAYHTLGVARENKLITWGRNDHGQCGIGTNDEKVKPTTVDLPLGTPETKIYSISGGKMHSAVVLTNGNGYLWGANDFAQLGKPIEFLSIANKPVKVEADYNIKQIQCGYTQSQFLLDNGKVLACGQNDVGQLGVKSHDEIVNEPTEIQLDEPIKDIMCSNFNAVISENNSQYIWGNTPNGLQTAQEKIVGQEKSVEQAILGEHFVCVLDNSNFVYSWGRNESGQLGLGDTEKQKDACSIDMLNEREITSQYCGRDYVMVLGMGHQDKKNLMSRSNIGEASNENQDYEEEEEEEEIENQTGVEDEHQEDDTQRLQEPQNEENDDDYYEDEDGPGTYNDQTDERQDLTEDRRPNPNQNQSSQEPYEQESDTQNLNDDETDPRHSQIHLKNSITQIYKNREYPVSNNSGDTTDPSVEKLRRDMAIMKQLICCYELNRQGLVKQLGNLTEKKPKLLNDMNQESVEK